MASSSGSPRRPETREWIRRYILLQQRYDVRLDRLLERVAKDLDKQIKELGDKPGIGAQVRRQQLIGSRGVITRLLREFWLETGDLVRAGREEAADTALDAGFDWDEILLARLYPDEDDRTQMRKYLLGAAERNIDAMLRRVYGVQQPLSKRVYKTQALANGWVTRAVEAALAGGSSAEDLSRRVRSMISPKTPGGVTYAARRLARTEINNVFHAQTVTDNEGKPWNTGMKWRISKSHVIPDECDEYSKQENGMGPGVFPLHQVPAKPHPQCFCYVTPETLSVAQFDAAFERGEFDAYLQERYGSAAA